MNRIILFLIPPIVGSVIGYVTNVLAIKMLFRPLNEIRIFKIKLPFTPGILPRNRSKLAQSIGSMVERELITPEIIRLRLGSEDVHKSIKNALSSITENILEKTLNEFISENKIISGKITGILEKLYPVLISILTEFLKRDDIRRELESKGKVILQNLILKLNPLQRIFLTAGQYDTTLEQKMPEIIDDLISNIKQLLDEPKIKNKLLESIISSNAIGQKMNARSLLNINIDEKEMIDNFLFNKLMTAADSQIENILSVVNVKTLVSDRIDSLDMLRVEKIILDVMSDQFKWVEIFGAILGFLIGLFQSVFNMLF